MFYSFILLYFLSTFDSLFRPLLTFGLITRTNYAFAPPHDNDRAEKQHEVLTVSHRFRLWYVLSSVHHLQPPSSGSC
jgi:hypothetical protein